MNCPSCPRCAAVSTGRSIPSRASVAASAPSGSSSSASYDSTARGRPSVADWASSRCSIHSSRDSPTGQSLRATSESATSRGWRSTNSAAACTPIRSSTGHHNGSNRHMRGSFTAHSTLPENSSRSSASSAAAAAAAASVCSQCGGNGRGSFQERPSAASNRSWMATTPACSQNPLGLSGPGCISSLPSSTPHRRKAPVTAEVPLRCMPSTRMARCGPADFLFFFDPLNANDSPQQGGEKYPPMLTARS